MGCGSSRARGNVSNQAEEAEAKYNAALAAHLSAILDIAAVSDTVVRYVAQLRSEGCDTPNDFQGLAADELAGDPFNFKRLHVQKLALSRQREELTQAEGVVENRVAAPAAQVDRIRSQAKQVDTKVNTTLAKHLSLIFGISPASADINNYLSYLRSEGCDTPKDFQGLTADELAEDPFNFKRLHVQKVALSRQNALAKHLSRIFGISPASADITNYLSGLRSEGCDTPQDFDGLPIDELAWEPFNFKRLHLQKVCNAVMALSTTHCIMHVCHIMHYTRFPFVSTPGGNINWFTYNVLYVCR